MKDLSRRMAACGLGAALSVTLLVLGGALGVMTYASPLLAGLVVGLIRAKYGPRDALTMWGAAALLGLLLSPELELSALFAGLFGWYPAAKPALDRLPRGRRWLAKTGVYLAGAALAYGGLYLLLGLDQLGFGRPWELGLLLGVLGAIFALYDCALTRVVPRLARRLAHLL